MAFPSIPSSHKGMLHRALGVPQGQKIPMAKLQSAKNSKDPHMRKMANYAMNFGHPKSGSRGKFIKQAGG